MKSNHSTFKAVIVDDEPNAINNIKIILNDYCEGIEIAGTANSVIDGIKVINKTKPDILLLDIEMPYGTGFDIVESISQEDVHIVFITAYDNYAIRAIKANAVDYIMKPIDIDEFIQAMDKVKARIEEEKKEREKESVKTEEPISQIAVPISKGIRTIPVSKLLYLEADGSYSKLHLIGEAPLLISRNLKQFEDALPSDMFYRIHHGKIINTKQIIEYNRKENMVTLTGDIEIEVSRRKRDEFLDYMQETAKFV